jgi:predicted Zn-dependent protease
VLSDPKYAGAVTDLAGVAVNLAMQGYSRDDEREADELGVKYAVRAGYNPRGALDLMETFKALEKDEPGRVEQWFASHPRTSERIRNVSQEMDELKRKHSEALNRPLRRDDYLKQVDGIPYGESNSAGYISGRRYIGVQDAYSLLVPEGWSLRLSGPEVMLQGASEGARAEMKVETLARPGVSGDIAKEFARKAAGQGIEVLGPVTRAGLPAGDAAIVKMRGKGKDGRPIIAQRMFLVRFDKSYVLTFIAPEEKSDSLEPVFQKLTGSIKFLGPGDAEKFPPPRLRLYTVQEGDTWGSIASKQIGPQARPKELAELNGRDPQGVPEPGLLIKIPPREAAGA